MIFAAILLSLSAAAGAFLSHSYRHSPGQYSYAWLYLTSVFSTTSWILIVRSSYRLSISAAVFDSFAAFLYLAVFFLLGEKFTPSHAFGAFLSTIGIFFMSR